MLGGSRLTSALVFIAVFLLSAAIALGISISGYFLSGWGISAIFGTSLPSPVKSIQTLLSISPFVVLLPLLPSVASILAPGILRGLSDPKPAIPGIRTAVIFLLPAYGSLQIFQMIRGGNSISSFTQTFWTITAIAIVLL